MPARHGLTPEVDCGPASGVVLASDVEPTLYLAGDTVWYPEVARTLERFHPQVTVLNCCGATLASRGRIIMDEEDVLAVCQVAPWTCVVASHMEAVNHGNVSRTYLRVFVDRMGVAPFEDGWTTTEWINAADERLYAGKTSGKNKVVR